MELRHKPVSAELLQSLRGEMSRHPILVWLDLHNHYSGFVDQLATATGDEGLPGPVLRHRGSYLELMFELDKHASGTDPSPLLVHLPGANEDSVAEGPLLELYTAGYRFRKAIDTAVKDAALGRIPPEEVDVFLAEPPEGKLSLDAADTWMAGKVTVASNALETRLRGDSLTQLITDLYNRGPVASMLPVKGAVRTAAYAEVWHSLSARFGVPETWRPDINRAEPSPGDVADVAASWAMCVEFVEDLQRDPVTDLLKGIKALDGPFVEPCQLAAQYMRGHAPDVYKRLDIELSAFIAEEKSAGSAADLGKVDTFHFEEQLLYAAALDALTAGNAAQALTWARDRLAGRSFWLEQDTSRKGAWRLIRAAAELGVAIEACTLGFGDCTSLAEGAQRYAEQGAKIDRLHRHLGQLQADQLYRTMRGFEALRDALHKVVEGWEAWAEATALEWTALCEREGALPDSSQQQRRIFDDVVAPLLSDDEKTVYFLVDALRFEMAQELLELIGDQKASAVTLATRLSELPSVTEVGMSALAPVNDGGKLRPLLHDSKPRLRGFQAAQFKVNKPAERARAIASRAGGIACPWHEIAGLLAMNQTTLRKSLKDSRLAVVHSIQIDKSGESGNGYSVFGNELDKLRKAWKLLRDAGVRRFVFTADHGFLLRRIGSPTLTYGKVHDAKGRYALSPQKTPTADQFAVSFAALQYHGAESNLLFPRGIAVYQSAKDRNFVHGGNSPQERVIPVLTIRHKQAPGDDDQRYAVTLLHTKSVGSGQHEVRAQVDDVQGQTGLAFSRTAEMSIDIQVVGYPNVLCTLVDGSGGAALEGGRLRVQVGQPFEATFRLRGPKARRVQVRLVHPEGNFEVASAASVERLDVWADPSLKVKPKTKAAPKPVTATAPTSTPAMPAKAAAPSPEAPTGRQAPSASSAPPEAGEDWLTSYEDVGQRRVFAHIDQFGAITEAEATAMLGGPRKWRRFAKHFESLAARAPFKVEKENVGGVTRCVKK